MPRMWLGILALLCVAVATGIAIGFYGPADAQAPFAPPGLGESGSVGGDGTFAFSTVVGNQYQQVTVVEPKRQVIAVYQIDLGTGAIRLCSVRSIQWDLQITVYNGEEPLPQEIHDSMRSAP